MKRWIALPVVTLALTLAFVASTPPETASATACTTSLTCNPANAPILQELGIITTPAGTTVVAPAVTTTAAAGVNWSGIWTAVAGAAFAGGASALGPVFMGSNGWTDQELTINPDYEPGRGDKFCNTRANSDFPGRMQGECNVLSVMTMGYPTSTYPLAHYYDVRFTVESAPLVGGKASYTIEFEKLGELEHGNTIYEQGQVGGGSRAYCFNGSTLLNAGSATGWGASRPVGSPITFTCSAGDQILVLMSSVTTGTDTAWGVAYDSTYGGYTAPGDTVAGDVRTTVNCKRADGSEYPVYAVAEFVVTGDQPIPVPDAHCLPGEIAISGTVEWRPIGTTDWLDLIEADVPPAVKEWMNDYPECFSAEVNPCAITLWKVNAQGDLESCGTIGQFCPDWAKTDPDLLTARYKCKYGAHETDIGMCSAYRSPTTGVQANVDDQGEWLSPTAPVTTPNVKTDEELADLGIDLSEVIDTTGSGDCWPSGWGVLNPLSWVYMPVKCVLEWAFVPSQDVMTDAQGELQTALDESIFGDTETLVDAVVAPFQIGSSGCQGPPFRINIQGLPGIGMDQTYYPLSACTGPMVGVAGFFRILSQGFVLLGSGLAALRYFASIAGFVGPGSTGSATSTSSVRFKESA